MGRSGRRTWACGPAAAEARRAGRLVAFGVGGGRPAFLGVIMALIQVGSAGGQMAEVPFAADLERAGVTLSDLDERFIGPQDLEDAQALADVGELLKSRHIPRLRVQNISGGHHGASFPLCVMLGRYREGDPSTGCMTLRVDGRPATQQEVMALAVSQVHSIVVLRGSEAMRVTGSDGQPGAVLIYRRW